MTQLKAVNETIKMWRWLARNPDKGKKDYFIHLGIAEYFRPAKYCYLCKEFYNNDCKGCVLNTKTLQCLVNVSLCGTNPPYDKWNSAFEYNKERTKQAMRIVRACERWIKKRKG